MLTTHDMDEAAKLCDRVGIVDHGQMLALDTPAALVRSLPGSATLEVGVRAGGVPAESVVEALGELAGVERVELLGSVTGRNELGAGPASVVGPALGDRSDGSRTEVATAARTGTDPDTDTTQRLRIYVAGEPAALVGPVVSVLSARGASVADMSLGEATLEDVFIGLTGRDLR
jgi:ABC-2 type transport system ATP-binding protein